MSRPVPATMRAAAIDRFGGPDVLRTQLVPVPVLDPDEVLIRVEHAGIGAWDPGEREGRYAGLYREMHGADPSFPYVIGFDGAGVVAAVGDRVTSFAVGDRVYADRHLNPKGGFYAEYAAVTEAHVHHAPDNLSGPEAGALPVDGITALIGLTDVLDISAGESLLVFGASGGLGHMTVQLAKLLGARVLAVASGQDGVELALRYGADAAVDGRRQDIVAAAADFAAGGVDKALLTAGGDTAQRMLDLVREGGAVAFPRGVAPEPLDRPGRTLVRYIGDHPSAERWQQLNELVSSGPFEVHVARAFSLDDAAAAHAALKEHHLGKLVLDVGDR